MKKILFCIIITFTASCSTSPQSVLNRIYDIDISNLSYEVIELNNEWCINGDYSYWLQLKIINSEDVIVDKLLDIGAKQFPIPSTMCPLRFMEYTNSTNGYYFAYEDDSCFKILIYDNESYMLYAYAYQI